MPCSTLQLTTSMPACAPPTRHQRRQPARYCLYSRHADQIGEFDKESIDHGHFLEVKFPRNWMICQPEFSRCTFRVPQCASGIGTRPFINQLIQRAIVHCVQRRRAGVQVERDLTCVSSVPDSGTLASHSVSITAWRVSTRDRYSFNACVVRPPDASCISRSAFSAIVRSGGPDEVASSK